MYSNNSFEKPHSPVGYIAFCVGSKSYIGRFYKLDNLREFAKSHHISPDDLIVFRVFHPDKTDFDRRVMDISDYAYSHIEIRPIGGIITEVKSWSWEPQERFDDTEEFDTLKNSFILFLNKISKFFSILP